MLRQAQHERASGCGTVPSTHPEPVEGRAESLPQRALNNEAEENWVWNEFSRYGGADRRLWGGIGDAASEGTWVWSSGQPVQPRRLRGTQR